MVITMSKHPWSPETATERQLRLRQAAIDAFQRLDQADADAWELAGLAHAAGVPMEDLAEHTRRSRATLFRRAPRTPNAALWMGDNFDEIKAVRPDARLTADGDLEVERVNEPGTWVVVGRNYVVHRREAVE